MKLWRRSSSPPTWPRKILTRKQVIAATAQRGKRHVDLSPKPFIEAAHFLMSAVQVEF